MFPAGSPSSTPVIADYLAPDNIIVPRAERLLLDYEMGGIHLSDPSVGLQYQQWKMWKAVDNNIKVSTITDTDITTIFNSPLTTELSFTFDQSMRLAMTYVENTTAKYRWFDTFLGATVTTSIPDGAYSPVMALDDKRPENGGNSDILLIYLRGNACYYRLQRDRFLIEYLYANIPPGVSRIVNWGMNKQYRFQIQIHTS